MPYRSVADLPKAQVDQYSAKGKRAFLHAFNSAVYDQGLSEERAFKIAHHAARQASRRLHRKPTVRPRLRRKR